MNTDLEALYKDIVSELQSEKELSIHEELKGEVNGVPFMTVWAVRISVPKLVTGTLREVSVTITGVENDYLIEIHTGAWFRNMAMPYMGVTVLAGPLAGLVVAGTTGLMAAQFGRKLKNTIKKLVKKHSKSKYSDDKVETFFE